MVGNHTRLAGAHLLRGGLRHLVWNALEQPLQRSRSPRELSQIVQNPNRVCLIAHSEQNQSPAGMDPSLGCIGDSVSQRGESVCVCTRVGVCVCVWGGGGGGGGGGVGRGWVSVCLYV